MSQQFSQFLRSTIQSTDEAIHKKGEGKVTDRVGQVDDECQE